MGPHFFSAENFLGHRGANPQSFPSMGPHFFSAENEIDDATVERGTVAFNGAALF